MHTLLYIPQQKGSPYYCEEEKNLSTDVVGYTLAKASAADFTSAPTHEMHVSFLTSSTHTHWALTAWS